jgi:hypothetical protein
LTEFKEFKKYEEYKEGGVGKWVVGDLAMSP